MISKKEDCILIFMQFTSENEMLVREIVKSGRKVRLVTGDLKVGRIKLYDIIEKLDGIYNISSDGNWDAKIEEITKIKNGISPNIVMIISPEGPLSRFYFTYPTTTEGLECIHFNFYQKVINYFTSKENYGMSLKKFILVNIDTSNYEKIYRPLGHFNFRSFMNYQTEKTIKNSGLNYIILRTPHYTFPYKSYLIPQFNIAISIDTVKDILLKIITSKSDSQSQYFNTVINLENYSGHGLFHDLNVKNPFRNFYNVYKPDKDINQCNNVFIAIRGLFFAGVFLRVGAFIFRKIVFPF